MSYAGVTEACPHGGYDRNCTKCIVAAQEARGVRDERGVNHAGNGGGWCVGHVEGPGDGRCTVLVRHCPVLNTPEQLAENHREDRRAALRAARAKVSNTHAAYEQARRELQALRQSGPA